MDVQKWGKLDIKPRGDPHPIVIIPDLNRLEDDIAPLGQKNRKSWLFICSFRYC